MKKGGIGGANTKTGLAFEIQTDFPTFLASQDGYSIENIDYDTKRTEQGGKTKIIKGTKLRSKPFRWSIKFLGDEVGQIFQKTGLYRYFDEIDGFDYTKIISAQLLPDEAIFVVSKNTVYIVEKKWQESEGSVDEKLLGFGNKRRIYQRLLDSVHEGEPFSVQFIFVGNKSFFGQDKYRDTFEMLRGDGIKIMLDEYDMPFFGLF